jgi:hypothetical protein
VIELQVLQGVRLKGRVEADELASTVGEDPASVARVVDSLTECGLLVASKSLRITADGRARLSEMLAAERAGIDHSAVVAAYDDFRNVNADFKVLVSDWQLKDGSPNTHEDTDYDAAILVRLDRLHEQTMPIVAAAAKQIPRLAGYADKLCDALGKVCAGETIWLARPIIDSYHTVWFELHEELIGAAGLTREDEAAAGHA